MTNETTIAIEYLTELRDSRQKVLPNEAPHYEAEKDKDLFNIAIKALEERSTCEWIPISERLPKYNKTVLISVKQIGKESTVFTAQRRKRFKTPDIFRCCTDNDGWWDFRISAWDDDHEVIAWMPLPEAYKEAEHPAVEVGDEVIDDIGRKGIIIREPYQIGIDDDPLSLVVVWYGRRMGDAKLQDIQPTGKKYPEIVKIMEELKG